MALRLILLSLILMAVSAHATQQLTHPQLRQYTLRDGLSQMQVMCLFQDSHGYIWVGTKAGLNRFDGDKITSYTEKDGLNNAFINGIFEDYSGTIWVITPNGLSSFDGLKFSNYPIPHLYFQAVPTPDGKIWCLGTTPSKNGIFGCLENGHYTSLIENYPELSPITHAGIGYLKQNKSLIICTGTKIFGFSDAKLRQLMVCSRNAASLRLEKQDSSLIFYEWDQSNNLKVHELNEGKIIQSAQITNCQLIGRNYTHYNQALINLGVRSQVFLLKPGTFEIKDFPDKYLNACLVDRDNHLWLGTEEGLFQCFSGEFETYKREYLPMIWSIVEDHQKNIWFASYNFGLTKLDGQSIKNYSADSLRKIGEMFYYQPQVDQRGVIYFPNNKGILYYDGKSFGRIIDSLCTATYYDSDHKLLFGSFYNHLQVYDLNHHLVRRIDRNDGLTVRGHLSSYGKDRDGNLWIGGGNGLVKYNWETGKIMNYTRSNGRLPSDGVVSIYTIPNGDTWFGGLQGLLWYDQKNDSIRKIQNEEITETVNLVSSIDSTWLVFSQPMGIYLMDLKKFKKEGKVDLTLFNERNGFGGLEPGQNGAMKDSKGNIWMTTGTEVVKLDPKALDFHKDSVNIRVNALNGKLLTYHQKEIELPPNDRTAVVQFGTICFNRPKSALYSWKTEGSDRGWSPWQKEDYAVLTNLPDGKSLLQVKTKIQGLPHSETMVSIPVVVSLAIWKQEWFFPALFGLVSIMVILALSLLLRARAQMIQISKKAKMFQLQAILSQMNPHFIFNVMASLQSMILSANIQKANEYLVKMSNLVRGFLEASSSSGFSRSKELKQSELPLKKELDILDNFIQFQQLIYPDRFDYELFVDPSINPDKLTLPPMLIQPFVENSIKHGLLQKDGKGNLKVRIYYSEEQTLTIEIEDNGIGMKKAEELMQHSHLLYTSRGKELTLKRIKLLNEMGYTIHFEIQSTNQGTKITLKILDHVE